MNKQSSNNIGWRSASVVALLAFGLAGCASFTHLDNAGKPSFPAASDSWTKNGRGASVESMRLGALRVGMDSKEAYDALGAPHFSEGLGKPEFWDYIVRFEGRTSACRLKLQWDQPAASGGQSQTTYVVKAIYWSEGCPPK